MKTWIQAVKHYKDPRVLSMIFFGVSSGLPFLLTLATMNIWLTKLGLSSTTIGQLAFIHIPYTLKFLWSPFIDKYNIPFLSNFLGNKRSWLLISQIGLILSVFGMSQTNPSQSLGLFAFFGFLVSFFSASQDLVLGGYRIEILSQDQQGAGTGALWIGYRIGLLASGSGALYLSSIYPWDTIYFIMGCLLIFGLIITLLNPKEKQDVANFSTASYLSVVKDVIISITSKPKWFLLPIFIVFYKAGDGIFGAYTDVFLSGLGYSNIDLSQGNLLGVFCSIMGGFLGGVLIGRYGSIHTLKLCAIFQIMTCGALIFQSQIGLYKPMLFTLMSIKHFYLGIGGAALYGFLSLLCTSKHTATQFALLCSFGSFSRIISTWVGGWVADQIHWEWFFFFVSFAGLFYILLLKKMNVIIPENQTPD